MAPYTWPHAHAFKLVAHLDCSVSAKHCSSDKCMLGHVNCLQATVSQNKTQLRVLEEAGHTHQRSRQLQPANGKLDMSQTSTSSFCTNDNYTEILGQYQHALGIEQC